ncbi:MAG: hypothetical protein JO019_03135 [Candidatus Kaiserbacteria bacterium]|nr:hypothetical protein [Candidatus Kaiserbacteria bacterium]
MPPPEHESEKIERLRRAMYSRAISDKLKERPRRPLEQPESPVSEDWREPEQKLAGVTVAPRYIGATRTALTWVLVSAAVFFTAAVAFFAYFFFLGGGANPASPSNIDITVTGPAQISGGSPAELQISVVNRNNVPLELSDLVVTYPPGTRSPTDFSTDLPETRIPLGTIEPGGTRQGTISAVFAGDSGTHASVHVELEYHVGGSNAIFVASSDYALLFSSSPLSLSVDGNSETVSGQPIQFNINVTSNANAPLKDVLLHVDYPFGFKFTSASPAPDSSGTWALGDFSPGEKKTVTLTGTMSGEAGDARVFHLAAGTRVSPSNQSISTKLADNAYQVKISQPFLGLSVSVNKSSGTTATVAPGDPVNVVITYQNNLSTAITDAVIAAKLSGLEVDGTTVRSSDGFYRSGDDVVIWDKTTTQNELAQIPAGGTGTVSFSFVAPAATSGGNAHVDISINAAGKRLGESGVPQSLQAAALQKVQIASDLELTAQGLYNANPFGSTGPMPPKASTETTYAMVFTVTNTTSKVTNAKLTATMPTYVRWVGIYSPSSEKVTFNQLNGTVTWDLGDIAPGVGLNGVEPRQAAIAIGFTPSTSQIGQSPVLLQNITLTGYDSATGDKVTRTAKDITTNILGDPGFQPADATVVK